MSVHPVAQSGFASDTTNYDSSRPEHQVTAVVYLLSKLAIPQGGTIIEVGSGTGKFTSHLLSRPERWKVICIEPSEVSSCGERAGLMSEYEEDAREGAASG
jgi:phospholipid N-methyltransferase